MDAIQFFMTRHGAAHADAEGLFTGLTDDQIRACPTRPSTRSPGCSAHRAGRRCGHQPPCCPTPDVDPRRRLAARLNVTRRDVGTAMTDEEVSDLSARIDLGSLRDYWHAVGERTVAVLRDVRPDDLDEVNDAEYVRRMCDDDAIFSDAAAAWSTS